MNSPANTGVRTALVTESGSPAGRACAEHLACRGFRIVAVDTDARNLERTAAVVAASGSDCTPLLMTPSKSNWQDALSSIARSHGGVDLMVNVVEVPEQKGLFELTESDCAPVDAHELVAACRAVAIQWVREQRSGRIITILPERAASAGPISAGAFAATTMFSECLHLEIRKHGCSSVAVLARSAAPDAIVAALADVDDRRTPPIRRRSIAAFPVPGFPLRPRRGTPPPRIVVITGAGSGIGRATAKRYASAGSTVLVSDIDRAAAENVTDEIRSAGGTAHAYQLDVRDVHAFESFAASVRRTHGTPDLVVNNAGIAILGEIVDSSPEDWTRVTRINLVGMVHGTRLFGAQMAEDLVPGHIVNVASAAAFLPMASLASYSATKAGVRAFTDCAALELSQYGIRTSVICPGPIATNIFASTAHSGTDAVTRSIATRALFDRAAAWHIIPGADFVARAIESAVARDIATVLVRPESYGVYALRMLTPGVLRNVSGAICNKRNITLMYRTARTGIAAKILRTGESPREVSAR